MRNEHEFNCTCGMDARHITFWWEFGVANVPLSQGVPA